MPPIEVRERPQVVEAKHNFALILRETYDGLLRNAEPDRLRFGPTYTATTSKGEGLRIPNVAVAPTPGQTVIVGTRILPLEKSVVLFAQNGNGEIVGFRHVDIARDKDSFEASGSIATSYRGEGIAHTLDSATSHLLTSLAADGGIPVYWWVENGNLRRVKKTEKMHTQSTDPEAKAVLANVRDEQTRWQALYGAGGKLGFDKAGTKIIEPSGYNYFPGFNRTDVIPLTGSLADSEAVIRGDEQEIQEQKRAEYALVLKPQIEGLIR